jgi:hypothetical protein
VAGWGSAPQAHSTLSNINFDIWFLLWRVGDLYEYPMKNILRTKKFLPTWGFNQRYFLGLNRLKCLGGFLHLKPTAGCQISTLIFNFLLWRGFSLNIPWKIYQGWQSSWPLGVSVKGIVRAFNWLKCLCGVLHLKPTVGFQISTLIFEIVFMEGGLYEYQMKNILRTAKFFPTWGFNQRYFPGL